MSACNFTRETVLVTDLKHGDTVEVDGGLETVSKTHLKHCNFIGNTYKGNTFRNGITKIIFIVQTSDGVRYE